MTGANTLWQILHLIAKDGLVNNAALVFHFFTTINALSNIAMAINIQIA